MKITPRVSPFLAWGDFHARSRFACSTILEEKWGTTRSLVSLSVFVSLVPVVFVPSFSQAEGLAANSSWRLSGP